MTTHFPLRGAMPLASTTAGSTMPGFAQAGMVHPSLLTPSNGQSDKVVLTPRERILQRLLSRESFLQMRDSGILSDSPPVSTGTNERVTTVPAKVIGKYGLPDISGIPDYIRNMLVEIPSGMIDGRAVSACYMFKQPLTNEQFERIMGRKSNSHQADDFGYGTFDGPKQAVVKTSQKEFAEVAKKMTELCRGVIVFGFPAADQAQLGAQGGKNHEYPTKSGCFSTREMNTWEGYQERKKRDPNATATVDVTQYDPNDYGLYPGDVWIFCEDGFLCGGSWFNDAVDARAAYRFSDDGYAYGNRGWRGVALPPHP